MPIYCHADIKLQEELNVLRQDIEAKDEIIRLERREVCLIQTILVLLDTLIHIELMLILIQWSL